MGTKHYDKSFKEQAVRLSEKRGSLSAVSREIGVSRTTVTRYMRELGLRSRLVRKFKVTTDSKHNNLISPNLLFHSDREVYSTLVTTSPRY